ncbi:MAG: S8 family serine peptidase [Deltaproteobacteria bacterium]|nr:S8 family serine peptidase [Deltaproteobacteria bacterium]
MKEKLTILGAFVIASLIAYTPISKADRITFDFPGNKQAPTETNSTGKYLPGELLVKFKQETPRSTMKALHSALGVKEAKHIKPLRVRRVKLPPDVSVEAAIDHYKKDPNVVYAEPNYIIRFMATTPNDPDFQKLWGLHNTGQELFVSEETFGGTEDADIDAPEAWDITTGSQDVIVAVLDSGVYISHPEMNANIWVNSSEQNGTNEVDDDDNGYVDDIYGWDFWDNDATPVDYNNHGTHIAGIIAALGDNNAGITGVNWQAKIMALRIGGLVGTIGEAAEAIIYAVDNGAHIINASWGGSEFSQTEYDAIEYADDHGVLVVAAAGNGGDDLIGDDNDETPEYPASYNLLNIISVAATDQNDVLAEFSNYGATSVHIAAPGVNIYSTVPQFSYGNQEQLYTEEFADDTTNWVSGGTNNLWAFTDKGFTGYCLEDSPIDAENNPLGTYLNNTESFAGYDTSFDSEKNHRYTLSFKLKMDFADDSDFLALIGSDDSDIWFLPDVYFIDLGNYRTGTTTGYLDDSFDLTALADVLPSFYFGFYLYANDSANGDGVYIDNLKLTKEPIEINTYGYEYIDGSSMAAPHVSGVAALVKAQNPNYTHLQIKDAILNTVDKKDSLDAKLITEGRVNAYQAVTYLAPPANVRAISGDGLALLTWDANVESTLTGYKVRYGTTQTLDTELEAISDTSLLISGLTNGTRYYFSVRATAYFPEIDLAKEADSDLATATPSTIPIAPSSLSATSISTSQIDLSWVDNYYGEQGFKVERKQTGEDYSQIATVGENVTTYSDTDLNEATTYYYRIRAYNAAGNSDFSNEASTTTFIDTSPIGGVTSSNSDNGGGSCFIATVGLE